MMSLKEEFIVRFGGGRDFYWELQGRKVVDSVLGCLYDIFGCSMRIQRVGTLGRMVERVVRAVGEGGKADMFFPSVGEKDDDFFLRCWQDWYCIGCNGWVVEKICSVDARRGKCVREDEERRAGLKWKEVVLNGE
jgi:hypothetical protein